MTLIKTMDVHITDRRSVENFFNDELRQPVVQAAKRRIKSFLVCAQDDKFRRKVKNKDLSAVNHDLFVFMTEVKNAIEHWEVFIKSPKHDRVSRLEFHNLNIGCQRDLLVLDFEEDGELQDMSYDVFEQPMEENGE